jgi:hypothetical protein
MITGRVFGIVAALLATCALSAEVQFEENFNNGVGSIWKKVEFEGETKHSIEKEGTNLVLKASASSSASGLAVKLNPVAPKGAKLSWRWKIDRVPPGGSEDKKSTFDHTARIFIAFKTRLGPPRTVNYVWANSLPVGKTFQHPSSGRSRFVVLQSANSKAGKWIEEERNIAEDWKLLFNEDDVPEIVGIGFMTDSDGTRSNVTGWYDDIRLERN